MADSWEAEKKFIFAVEGSPILYDQRRKDFKDQLAKYAAWKIIGDELGYTVDECIKLWKKLRDKYVKMMKPLPSGSAAAAETSWELFPLLQFLQPCVKRRKTISNIKPLEDDIFDLQAECSSSQLPLSQLSESQLMTEGNEDLSSNSNNASTQDNVPSVESSVPQSNVIDFRSLGFSSTPQINPPSSETRKRKAPDEFEIRILEALEKKKN